MLRRLPRHAVRTTAVAGAAALLLAGASAAVADTTTDQQDQPPLAAQVEAPVPEIAWKPCEGEGLEAFDCAAVEVPTDYDEPEGETTTIALTRLPATDPDQRIGSLFVNFGGPGGPGVATMHQLGGPFLDPQVHAQFDVVGFDPRGVGLSDPVTCFPDQASENAFIADTPAFPMTTRERAQMLATFGTISATCELLSGDRIEHASTANVARDMDLLRQAVGDEQLSYLGYSYGSILGATYSALFPDNVRALAIDGTLDPEGWSGGEGSVGYRTGQGAAAAEVFDEFLAVCAEAGPESCALAALGDPGEVVEDVFTQLQEQPVEIPLPDGTTVELGYDDAVAMAFSALYSPALWGDLAATFAALAVPQQQSMAAQRSTDDIDSIGDLLRRLGLIEDYSGIGGALASMCVDGEHPLKPWEYQAHADAADAEAPHFGRYRAWVGLQCEFVSFTDEDAYTGPWEQTTEAPVLVIGTRYDPATPYGQTQPYADRFADASVLTVEGYGHGTLGISTCANAAIAGYLVDLDATDGATCEQDIAPFQAPPGEAELEESPLLMAPIAGLPGL
ncbi:alpha/beta hydrolase [Pseudactinotalea suaedae]|uniref:alpha/beta hydrolase n=1 Tax=Pseudactinotalea suaedae TaxID=1524924 RepID=UPI0012E22CB3|nr:alpha/beta hydrolase [Pseudactinotalea suaedae]